MIIQLVPLNNDLMIDFSCDILENNQLQKNPSDQGIIGVNGYSVSQRRQTYADKETSSNYQK